MKKYILIVLVIAFVAIWMKYGISPWASFIPERSNPYTSEKKSAVDIINVPNNLRQTPYDCGAYNIYGFLSAIGKDVDKDEIVRENRYQMIPSVGVVPEVIKSTLQKYDVDSRIRTFRWMSDEAKEKTLKHTLGLSKPVIALIQRHEFMHYVLLTGFDNDKVYFYDPLLTASLDGMTIDNTPDISGNDVLSFDEFIKLWNEVSYYGFYKNMAIIIDE